LKKIIERKHLKEKKINKSVIGIIAIILVSKARAEDSENSIVLLKLGLLKKIKPE
jgi:hypothetical protein